MNAFFKFWSIFKAPQTTRPGNKDWLIINGKQVKPTGLARRLQQTRIDRAAFNSTRDHFNEKFICPRHFRTHASIQP